MSSLPGVMLAKSPCARGRMPAVDRCDPPTFPIRFAGKGCGFMACFACPGEKAPTFAGLKQLPTTTTLDVGRLRVSDRGGQSIGRTTPTCAVGGAKDAQPDDRRHLGEGHRQIGRA